MLSLLLTLIIFAPAIWFGFMFVVCYRAATGTWYQRAWAGVRNSASILWMKTVLFADALLQLASQVAPAVSDDQTAAQIQNAFPSKVAAAAIAAIAVIGIAARMRTLVRGGA